MTEQKDKRFPRILLLSLAVVMVGCSPLSQGEDSDNSLHIAISPAAQPISLTLLNCASSTLAEDQQLNIESHIADAAELEKIDFAVQLGEAANGAEAIAELAAEKLLIVLHPSNPVRRLSREQIADLFSSRIQNWGILEGDDAEVALWIGPASNELRRALERELLAGGPVSGNARLASSPQHMLEAVSGDVHAIGILPAAWADSSVQSLDSGLVLPVLALAQGELSREARAILACLQSEQGQSILDESYSR